MFGVTSMTGSLRRAAMRKPGRALLGANRRRWHYSDRFDPGRVEANHAALAARVEAAGTEILWMSGDDRGIADAVFTYDASLMTPRGAILMAPGKPLRAGEQALHHTFYHANGIPVIGEVTGEGRVEGGDTLWLDEKTLAVGRSFRTNQSGAAQLAAILAPDGISVEIYDLPAYHGPDACLHLMSLLSFVGSGRVLICAPLIPVSLLQRLQAKGVITIETPMDEFEASFTLSANVLATGPQNCIMIDGFPKTRKSIEATGVEVDVFDGSSLCLGCEGGPTCLTLPILREGS